MFKKRVMFGILIFIIVAVSSALFGEVYKMPTVFASMQQEEIEAKSITNEAGEFSGEGYYSINEVARLIAKMNPGYKFEGWFTQAGDLISYETEYTFIVNENMTIEARWSRIKYSITYNLNLENDVNIEIVNNTEQNGNYYYNNSVTVNISTLNDVYIYDLFEENLLIRIGEDNQFLTLDEILDQNLLQNCSINIVNNIGFESLSLTFDVQDNIYIDMVYDYMYTLDIVSANDIGIENIINFTTLFNTYYKFTDTKYLIWSKQSVTINFDSNNKAYSFKYAKLNSLDANIELSQSYTLVENSVIQVCYEKIAYNITFSTYLKNNNGYYDEVDLEAYQIPNFSLVAGESLQIEYELASQNILINSTPYNYLAGYGYKFNGFTINDDYENITNNLTFTMDETSPGNCEIQILFEYLNYNFEIRLVDEFFNDVNYSFSFNTPNLHRGTIITVQATSDKYKISGWLNEINDDEYLSTQATYSFTFEPKDNNELASYYIYLDVDYNYYSVEFNLNSSSIITNVEYDTVLVDLPNNTITFKDSYNILPDEQIMYSNEDMSITDGTTIIDTHSAIFGRVTISNNRLTYGNATVYSNEVVLEDGVDKYTFDKYSYMAELNVGVIETFIIDITGQNANINVYGSIYSLNIHSADQLIDSVTSSAEFNDNLNAYVIPYTYTNIYLYLDDGQYSYISFMGVRFDWNGEGFSLDKAEINSPNEITYNSVQNSVYNIKLDNLIADNLIVYMSKTTSEFYGFRNHVDAQGVGLYSITNQNLFNTTILRSTSQSLVSAIYIRMQRDIYLSINDQQAYSENDVTFFVNDVEGLGLTISAVTGDNISIHIDENKITRGYKFDGYRLRGEDSYLSENAIYEFIMQNSYAGVLIDICFSPIDYTININYLDENGNIITDLNNVNGSFIVNSEEDLLIFTTMENNKLTSTIANINAKLRFIATSNEGYYVKNAYIGTDAYELTSLIVGNDSELLQTSWLLSYANFNSAIISLADSTNVVQMYIQFAIHTYSVKLYFDIDSNPDSISYPNIIFNGEVYTPSSVIEQEIVNGQLVNVKKYLVTLNDIEYGSRVDISFDDNSFMLGTEFLKWLDSMGNDAGRVLNLEKITSNLIFTAQLQYIYYDVNFVIVDKDGNEGGYGVGVCDGNISSFKLFDEVFYRQYPTNGYILVDKYYYNNLNQISKENIDSGFIFNPSQYLIENNIFKIYLVYDLKEISIEITNTKEANSSNFIGIDPSQWATFTVERERVENGATNREILNGDTGYLFKTNDKLIMTSTPINVGIDLSRVAFGNNGEFNVGFASALPYSLRKVDLYEQDENGNIVIVGVQYVLEITFTSEMISGLNENIILQNVFIVKKYNINYSYNLIDKNCNIKLAINNISTGLIQICDEDEPYIDTIDFGTNIVFSCDASTLVEISEKFRVLSFVIAGIEYRTDGIASYNLNDLAIWEIIALNRYNANSTDLPVILKLSPKITLQNMDEGTNYVYTRTYTGYNQGLTVGEDVIVANDFEIIIKYNNSLELPKNAGTYIVTISVIDADNQELPFEDPVSYVIQPAGLYLQLDNSKLPIEKTYNGTSNVDNINDLLSNISINGVLGSDSIAFASGITAFYEGSQASDNLYDIYLYNVVLVDNATNAIPNNYILTNLIGLASTDPIVFEDVGKINPRSIQIRGFTVNNKVYDGSADVQVNIDNIRFDNIVATDSANIIVENLRFYCEDYTIGKQRKVIIDYSQALFGADSTNYVVSYEDIYIDIHPYEIEVNVEGYGNFKLVDYDRLCLIPINSRLIVNCYDSDSYTYRQLYGQVETQMQAGENFNICYDFSIRVGVLNNDIPEGLYIFIPNINKLSKVVQVSDEEVGLMDYNIQDDYIMVRLDNVDARICLIAQTSYLPLWVIILIVAICAVVVVGVVIIFIIIRRRTKRKYSVNDRI